MVRRKQEAAVVTENNRRPLPSTEEQLGVFFDNSPLGACITSLDTRFLRVNAAFAEMLGYSPKELSNLTVASVTHPEDVALSGEGVRTLIAGERDVWAAEKRYVHRGGHVVWVLVTVRLQRSEHGEPLHFLGHIQDITDRKRSEAEAHATEERLLRQRNALIALAGVQTSNGADDGYAVARITETSAVTLGVDRVSFWRYNNTRTGIHCVDLFDLAKGTHSPGVDLSAAAYPAYFRALSEVDVIAADDANRDPRTAEFSEGYLRPLGITSMMDAMVRAGGAVVGVLCHEHVGSMRKWTADERSFAAALANQVSLALEEAERNRVEKTLRATEAALTLRSAALNAAANSIVITSIDGTISWANPAFTALTGYSVEEVIGRNPRDLLRSGVHDRAFYKVLWDTLLSGNVWRGKMTNRRKDGTLYREEQTITPLKNARGDVTHFISIKRDLSEQERVESELRDSESRFREMAEYIKEAFFQIELRPEGPVTVYISPTWAEIWGRPLSQAYEQPGVWLDAIHPEDRPAMAEVFRGNWEGRASMNVFRVVRPDGTLRWVRGRASPVRDASGKVYRVVGVSEDITELRRAEEQAIQAQRMEAVGRLAGGVAHDFNNLLTVILGEVELSMDPDLPPEVTESLGEIKNAGERASGLTRQLLAFSRRQVIEPVVFDVNAVVKDMSKMMGRLIGEDITITPKLAASPALVRADRGQVEQVLANLVVNSRDAMPQGGRLVVEVGVTDLDEDYARVHQEVTPGPYVMMAVSDTGTGMSDEVKARMFEPFFTTKERGKGTGLGLATCFGIVKQAGGHLSVYSEVGVGTTIKVFLSRIAEDGTKSAAVAVAAVPRGDETILLVEDDAGVRRVAARILLSQGYHVLEARDGQSALALLATPGLVLDLLLTDVVLPGMGGRQLSEQVRAGVPGVKVLFASGYTDDAILQHQLLEHGAVLVQKPFTRELLARKVREILDG